MKSLFVEPSRLLFLGMLLLLVAANHTEVFVTPWHENGDFALNALQVERAKNFNEIHGNYSRFHFNHPGPAFFYAYAAGEWLFHDMLQIVPSQPNAHILAGLILQAAFFAAALGIAASWVRSRWFLLLGTALAGLHFAQANHAFNSVWPPHVLLMPFLCFLVTCASIAAGRASHLWLAVVSGGFLVHGHVAQPLFVALIFPAAYGWMWWHATPSRTAPWKLNPRAHWLAGAMLVVFLVPFAVDLAEGSESNIAQILRFYLAPKTYHTYAEAIAYLLAFFGYWHDIERFLPDGGPVTFAHVSARAGVYAIWLGVVVVAVLGFRRTRLSGDHAQRRFLSALGLVLGVTVLAALHWGRSQTGPMFEFNAFFFHAVTFLVALFALAAVTPMLPETRAARVALWIVAPLGLFFGGRELWRGTRVPESTVSAGYDWFGATRSTLAKDPRTGAQKFLVFSHDDWGDVARTALALKRLGHSYRTDRSWAYMFGRYRTLATHQLDDLSTYSIWRFSRRDLPGLYTEMPGGLRVYFEPFDLDPRDATIVCTREGNLDRFLIFGITSPEVGFTWTNLPRAGLRFRSPPVERDVTITIDAEPFLPAPLKAQPMRLTVNGQPAGEFVLSRRDAVTAQIPASVWNRSPVVTLILDFPAARSPLELGLSADPRRLAWGLYSIRFTTP